VTTASEPAKSNHVVTGNSRTNAIPSCGDLFAGAGGLSLGFEWAGFKTRFFNELDGTAAKTFSLNMPGSVPFVCPIQELEARDVLSESGLVESELDVMIGGPPCQGFSINAPSRSSEDPRNNLFKHYVRLVLEGIRPKLVLMENVPGLISLEGGAALERIRAAFTDCGYSIGIAILNSAHYGVPQERWRLFLVGTREGLPDSLFPMPTHYSRRRANFSRASEYVLFPEAVGPTTQQSLFGTMTLLPPVTVEDAIGDLPPIPSAGGADDIAYSAPATCSYQTVMREGSTRIFNHVCSGLSDRNLERARHVPPGGSWRDIPFELLPAGMKRARRSDHTRRYGRLHPEGLSGTILTKCDPHWGSFFHYAQDRVISVREAARLHSFPDRFRFVGSRTEQYRQVGNAVPPLLAAAIAGRIRQALEREKIDSTLRRDCA